jgi:predicted transglutaminase-like cysteine proteinase
MVLGASALPPPGYVSFCKRQPEDCGADVGDVLRGARRAEAERAELLAMAAPGAVKAAAVRRGRSPILDVAPRAAAAGLGDALPAMTPGLWARLNAVNAEVNHALRERRAAPGPPEAERWDTPLKHGRGWGDCKDFVLEKQRALAAAGVPRQALSIALVVTPGGEQHAVLLAATRAGEFVLDNLSPWISPWQETRYVWLKRQVHGAPFRWAMVGAPASGFQAPGRGLVVAQAR